MRLKAYQMQKHGTVKCCIALESYQGDNYFILHHKVELSCLLQSNLAEMCNSMTSSMCVHSIAQLNALLDDAAMHCCKS